MLQADFNGDETDMGMKLEVCRGNEFDGVYS
jgi:hypothetical protein